MSVSPAFHPARRGTNGHIESFNRWLRREYLNRTHWTSLLEARVVIEGFKDNNNHRHCHSSPGYHTPAECAARCTHSHQPVNGCEID
ncbi:integrase core domain-containing protein [Rhodococcus wratislaviensis]|uniref:integrase core domain-containing protein n=1 Tax=Rhodococcus wratislaviensis TaxID=44752 RepID=UPI0009DF0A57